MHTWHLRHVTVRGNTMNRHSLHYIDLHPEPVEREPSALAILAGAALALVALWIACVFLFSL